MPHQMVRQRLTHSQSLKISHLYAAYRCDAGTKGGSAFLHEQLEVRLDSSGYLKQCYTLKFRHLSRALTGCSINNINQKKVLKTYLNKKGPRDRLFVHQLKYSNFILFMEDHYIPNVNNTFF